jgi:hypothetical protein
MALVIDKKSLTDIIQSILGSVALNKHSNGIVSDHLVGTYALLHDFGAGEALKIAGLLHNVYETEKFKFESETIIKRDKLKMKIGIEAERLVFLFANLDWSKFVSLEPPQCEVNFCYYFKNIRKVTVKEFTNVILLFFANIIEQIPDIPIHKIKKFEAIFDTYQSFLHKEQQVIVKWMLTSIQKEKS